MPHSGGKAVYGCPARELPACCDEGRPPGTLPGCRPAPCWRPAAAPPERAWPPLQLVAGSGAAAAAQPGRQLLCGLLLQQRGLAA